MNGQSGADNFAAPVGVQGSTASAGMVKQVVATAQADGSLVQNQATSAPIGRGASEKSFSAQAKGMNGQSKGADEFGAAVGVQGSTASAGMVKQVVATAQADGSLVRNPATSAQIGRGTSEKSFSAQAKSMNGQSKGADDFGAPVGAQGSTASAGMVKQVVATAQADGSLVQNPPPQNGPVVVTTNASLASNTTVNEYSPDKNTPPKPPLAGEPAQAQPEINATVPLGSAQTARLVQNLSETEWRVGIHAGEFGKVDIHTFVNQSQISARIYVEHDELGKALAVGLPQLHEKLSVEHRVDAQIELYNSGSSYSGGTDRQQQQQQRMLEQNQAISRDLDDTDSRAKPCQSHRTLMTSGLDMHI